MEKPAVDYKKRCNRLIILLSVAVALLIAAAALFVLFFRELPVIEAMAYIRSAFYDYDETNPEELTETALAGIAYALDDDYSDYYSPEEYEELTETRAGTYSGIGVLLGQNEDGTIEILQVYSGSSAESAGLREGDLLHSVDGQSVAGLTLEQAIALFRLDAEEGIRLEVLRDGETFTATVKAGKVTVPRATCELLNEAVGYIRIVEFNGAAAEETEACLRQLLDAGAKGAVIDLRDNPGGDLDICLKICNLFLKKGDVIVSTRSRQNDEEYYYAEKDGEDIPIVILINGGSASASELMTAALHDNGRAFVIGTRSYGKGIVQTIFPLLSNGGRIKFTTDKYFTPAGKCIQGEGITPDLDMESVSTEENGTEEGLEVTDPYIRAALAHFESVF